MASQSLMQRQLLKLTAAWELIGNVTAEIERLSSRKFFKILIACRHDGKTEPSSHGIFNPPVPGYEHT